MNRWLDINTDDPRNAKVLILGIPFDGGTSQEAGAAEGPAKLREFGAVYMPCATDDWHLLDTQPVVYDFGDVDMSGTWEESFARVEKEALALMRHDKFHLFLGGTSTCATATTVTSGPMQTPKNAPSMTSSVRKTCSSSVSARRSPRKSKSSG